MILAVIKPFTNLARNARHHPARNKMPKGYGRPRPGVIPLLSRPSTLHPVFEYRASSVAPGVPTAHGLERPLHRSHMTIGFPGDGLYFQWFMPQLQITRNAKEAKHGRRN